MTIFKLKNVIRKLFLSNKIPYPSFSLLIVDFLSHWWILPLCSWWGQTCVCNIEQVAGAAEMCSDVDRWVGLKPLSSACTFLRVKLGLCYVVHGAKSGNGVSSKMHRASANETHIFRSQCQGLQVYSLQPEYINFLLWSIKLLQQPLL